MTETIKFENIEDITKHVFAGNHEDDRLAFQAIDNFIIDDKNDIIDKMKATRHLEINGMGISKEDMDEIQSLRCVYENEEKTYPYTIEEEQKAKDEFYKLAL